MKGIAQAFGIDVSNVPTDYGREPSHGSLEELMDRMAVVTTHIELGTILLFVFKREPQHLGMYIGGGNIIHAYKRGVVTHILDAKWRNRIYKMYDIPGVE